MAKDEILAAIRQAAQVLGRAPSRGELKRLTGVSHYRVLSEFSTLRQAVRAAGLEPNPKGERISTGELLKDWQRVARKLGRRPSRAEYVRQGKYSAGALTVRFGAWGKIGENPTAEVAKDAKETENDCDALPRTAAAKKPRAHLASNPQASNHQASNHQARNHLARNPQERNPQERGRAAQAQAHTAASQSFENGADKVIAMRWAASLTQLPGELAGKRRVTEAVAHLVMNTLLGESQPSALSFQRERTYHGDTETQRATGADDCETSFIQPREQRKDLVRKDLVRKDLVRKDLVRKDRAIMGPPFDASRLTNAPMNELGVVFLFGMMAAELGFQVESLQARFPDCEAKREVHPGKWQRSRIEFEYESKNFALHGHDPRGCDVIVCWRHNWRECPPELEVVELCRVVGAGDRTIG